MANLYLVAALFPKADLFETPFRTDTSNTLLEDVQRAFFVEGEDFCAMGDGKLLYSCRLIDSEIFNIDEGIIHVKQGSVIIYAPVCYIHDGSSMSWDDLAKEKDFLEACIKPFSQSKKCFYDIRICLKEEVASWEIRHGR